MVSKSNKINLKLNSIEKSTCILGEGLFLDKEVKCWIDIEKNNLFLKRNNFLEKYKTKIKPSVILTRKNNIFLLGTEKGLVEYNISSRKEKIIKNFSNFHSFKDYRSNDGGFCDEKILLGFMHRKNAEKIPGYIYIVKNHEISLLDNEIHVPNSFIQISKRKILISDSLKGIVWLFELDKNGSLKNKTVWKDFNSLMIPDGGCFFEKKVFLAFWDAASIGIFTIDGKLINFLDLPSLRPTNCKIDPFTREIWITSALEGLTKKEVELYPQSGNTFSFDLDFLNLC